MPGEVKDRETHVHSSLETLAELNKKKRATLEDDLAREQFKDELSLLNAQHIARKKQIDEWVGVSTEYLNVAEKIESISAANECLNALKAYEADKVVQTNTNVTSLRALGEKIRTAGECSSPSLLRLTRILRRVQGADSICLPNAARDQRPRSRR